MEIAHKPLVLFLCTGSSVRSQMAEAILRARRAMCMKSPVRALSPRGVHPFTLEALEEVGISGDGLRSKSSGEFLGKVSVRFAIIVCEKANAMCPPFIRSRCARCTRHLKIPRRWWETGTSG